MCARPQSLPIILPSPAIFFPEHCVCLQQGQQQVLPTNSTPRPPVPVLVAPPPLPVQAPLTRLDATGTLTAWMTLPASSTSRPEASKRNGRGPPSPGASTGRTPAAAAADGGGPPAADAASMGRMPASPAAAAGSCGAMPAAVAAARAGTPAREAWTPNLCWV